MFVDRSTFGIKPLSGVYKLHSCSVQIPATLKCYSPGDTVGGRFGWWYSNNTKIKN